MMQILDVNAPLADYASPGHWNDAELLIEQNISNSWIEVVAEGKMKVRDLRKYQDFGEFSDFFHVAVKPHQCVVVRVHGKHLTIDR